MKRVVFFSGVFLFSSWIWWNLSCIENVQICKQITKSDETDEGIFTQKMISLYQHMHYL